VNVLGRFVTFTTQATILLPLPDIPGQVVQVRRVLWMASSFSVSTAVSIGLDHNVSLAVTLSTTESRGSRWCAIEDPHDDDGGSGHPRLVEFGEWPYELVGLQRFDHVSSAGTVSGRLQVLYTLRREGNRTRWNDLRARTSFERG
jgi:hypothetical protein